MDFSQMKKSITATAIEQMVTIPVEDKFSKQNLAVEIAKVKNLSSAAARYLTEDKRLIALVTLTFGNKSRVNFEKMSVKKILKTAKTQYNSLIAFLHKMRRSKRFKSNIRYFAVVEVQPEGGALHMHIAISVGGKEEMFSLVEFIHDFKGRYTKPYKFKGKTVYPIDRSHIGVSSTLKKNFEARYSLKGYAAKRDVSRVEYLIEDLEQRDFKSGNWTPLEFYTKTMMEERYSEQITDYLLKTLDGNFVLDTNTIKEGVAKCQLGHDTKSLLNQEDYLNKLYLLFIRQVGGKVYTHSRFPFPWTLYQKHRKALIAFDAKYKAFYSCIESIRSGELVVKNNIIYDGNNNIIAGGKKDAK